MRLLCSPQNKEQTCVSSAHPCPNHDDPRVIWTVPQTRGRKDGTDRSILGLVRPRTFNPREIKKGRRKSDKKCDRQNLLGAVHAAFSQNLPCLATPKEIRKLKRNPPPSPLLVKKGKDLSKEKGNRRAVNKIDPVRFLFQRRGVRAVLAQRLTAIRHNLDPRCWFASLQQKSRAVWALSLFCRSTDRPHSLGSFELSQNSFKICIRTQTANEFQNN